MLTQGIDFRMEFGIHKTNLIHVAVISMYLNMLLCTHAVRGGGRRDTCALATPSDLQPPQPQVRDIEFVGFTVFIIMTAMNTLYAAKAAKRLSGLQFLLCMRFRNSS